MTRCTGLRQRLDGKGVSGEHLRDRTGGVGYLAGQRKPITASASGRQDSDPAPNDAGFEVSERLLVFIVIITFNYLANHHRHQASNTVFGGRVS